MIKQLTEWLRGNATSDVLIPIAKDTKAPMFKHGHGEWSWAKLDRWVSRNPSHRDYGIVLKSLCVIDVDCLAIAKELEARFPVLRCVPRESSTKGMHYFFRRSELADVDGFYDSRSKVMKCVDFKTRTSKGSGGIIVVAPSHGKQWIDALCDAAFVPDIPEALLRAVALPMHPPIDATIQCADGETLVAKGYRHLLASPYVSMFYGNTGFRDTGCDADTVVPMSAFPLPVVRAGLEMWEDAAGGGIICCASTDDVRAVLADVFELYGFLCFPADRVLRVRQLIEEMLALDAIHPQASQALQASQGALVLIDGDLASTLQSINIELGDSALRLGRRAANARKHRLRADPTAALEAALPPYVLEWLHRFSGRLVVAGGFVTGAVVEGVPPGADIDLFVVADTEDEGNVVVDGIACTEHVLAAAYTGYALTLTCTDGHIVQIILVLNRDAASIINGFDLHPCRVMAGAESGCLAIQATATWVESIRSMAFPVLQDYWTDSSLMRLAKYTSKGFTAYFPGLDRAKVRKYMQKTLPNKHALRWWRSRCNVMRAALQNERGIEKVFIAEHFVEHLDAQLDAYLELQMLAKPLRGADYASSAVKTGALQYILAALFGAGNERGKHHVYRPYEADSSCREAGPYWRVYQEGTKCHAVHLLESDFSRWRS